MRSTLFALLVLTPAALAYDKVCAVKALGRGLDDGPNINAAFKECSQNAAIILDNYYSVNTLLLTEGLSHVDVLLSGTGETSYLPLALYCLKTVYVIVQYTPNIAYWSPNSLYLAFQNALVLPLNALFALA